jgi:hypothetical protein
MFVVHVRRSLSLLLAVFLSYQCIILGLTSDALAQGNYIKALWLAPFNSTALEGAAVEDIEAGSFSRAQVRATLALTRSPIKQSAVSSLAYANQQQGRSSIFDNLVRVADRLGWRDQYVQFTLLQKAMDEKDIAGAMRRADALLRQGYPKEEVFAYLHQIAVQRGGAQVIAARLALMPNWRNAFLIPSRDLTEQQSLGQQQVLLELARTRGRPTDQELAKFIEFLVMKQEYARARSLWLRLAEPRPAAAGLLFDGGFNRAFRDEPMDAKSPFDWVLLAASGASATVDLPQESMNGPALRVQASGSASGKIIQQTLVLQPGMYALTMNWRSVPGGSNASLRWKIMCLGSAGEQDLVPIRSPSTRRADKWRNQRFKFIVPSADCGAQRLSLHMYHDRTDPIDLWLDSIHLSKDGTDLPRDLST